MRFVIEQPLSFNQLGRRDNQEDSRYPDSDTPELTSRIFAVCDGVGGHEKGEVASGTIVSAIAEYAEGLPVDATFGEREFERMMDLVYRRLAEASTADNAGMASTLTFLCLNPGGAFVAHLGDSRVYQARPGSGIIFCTEDHSLVNNLIAAGVITPEEARNHPQKNVITRCVTPITESTPRMRASMTTLTDVRPGDLFMLCSDGVLECFTDEMLAEMLADGDATLSTIAQNIASECAAASRDNNTAMLVRIAKITDSDPASAPKAKSFFRRLFG